MNEHALVEIYPPCYLEPIGHFSVISSLEKKRPGLLDALVLRSFSCNLGSLEYMTKCALAQSIRRSYKLMGNQSES